MLKNIVTLLISAQLLFACSILEQSPKAPKITLTGASLVNMGLFEQTYKLRLAMQNPNNFDLPITGMTYNIYISGAKFTSGVTDQSTTLTRLSTTDIEVNLRANLLKIAPRLGLQIKDTNKANQKTFSYKIAGNIYTDLKSAVIPYEEQGAMSIAELMSN